MFGNEDKEHQIRRCRGKIQIGNIIKYKVLEPRSSIILGLPEQTLTIYVQLSKIKTIQIQISSLRSVGELQERIREQFKVNCEYLSFQQKILNYNDKLSDCQIINESILRVKHSFIISIELTVKLFQTMFIVHQTICNQTYEINKLKKDIEQQHKIAAESIRLFLGKDQIENKLSLADLGIFSNCTLLMKFSKILGIKNDTMIKLRKHANVKIQQIQKNSQIISFIPPNQAIQYKRHSKFQQKRIKNPVKLQLSNGTKLQFTKGMYFFSKKGWIICSDEQPQHLQIYDQIMLNSRQFVRVENICYSNNFHSVDITCLRLQGNRSFSANQVLISPAISIQVLYNQSHIFTVDLHESTTILDLKRRIQRIKNISLESQFLYIQNQQKILKDSLSISQIYNQNLVIQVSLAEINWKSKIQQQKQIIFKFNQEAKQFSYQNICNKTCQQVVRESFKEKVELNPYFGLLLNYNIIKINIKIQQLVNTHKEAFYYQTFEILVIKFPQKFIIRDLLMKFPIPKQQTNVIKSIFSTLSSKFLGKQSVKQRFLRNYQLENIKNILQNFHKCNLNDQNKVQHYKYISNLITYLSNKPNYFKKCYRIEQTNSSKFQEGTVITVREFLSCHTNKDEIYKSLGLKNGLILHINSITGKKISDEQIVFLPYTYFIVQSRKQVNNILHINLLQMPSPVTMMKNIILWVDDQPQNNIEYMQDKKFNHQTTEVIQLTSTLMAKRWFHQFGWIINRLKLNMRVVSDMVRYQYRDGQKYINYQAGIDLIQYLFNDCGFTTPSLIFCSDASKGRENLAQRGIRQDRFKQATNNIQILYNYMDFSKSLSEWQQQ